MRLRNKIIASVCAFSMLFTMGMTAVVNADTTKATVTATADKATMASGDTATVTVAYSGVTVPTAKIGGLQVKVAVDLDKFTFVAGSATSAFPTKGTTKIVEPTTSNPYLTYLWYDATSELTSASMVTFKITAKAALTAAYTITPSDIVISDGAATTAYDNDSTGLNNVTVVPATIYSAAITAKNITETDSASKTATSFYSGETYNFVLDATAAEGRTATYAVKSGNATIAGDKITFNGMGDVVVTATISDGTTFDITLTAAASEKPYTVAAPAGGVSTGSKSTFTVTTTKGATTAKYAYIQYYTAKDMPLTPVMVTVANGEATFAAAPSSASTYAVTVYDAAGNVVSNRKTGNVTSATPVATSPSSSTSTSPSTSPSSSTTAIEATPAAQTIVSPQPAAVPTEAAKTETVELATAPTATAPSVTVSGSVPSTYTYGQTVTITYKADDAASIVITNPADKEVVHDSVAAATSNSTFKFVIPESDDSPFGYWTKGTYTVTIGGTEIGTFTLTDIKITFSGSTSVDDDSRTKITATPSSTVTGGYMKYEITSGTSYASVNEGTGMVSGKKKGTAVLTATYYDKDGNVLATNDTTITVNESSSSSSSDSSSKSSGSGTLASGTSGSSGVGITAKKDTNTVSFTDINDVSWATAAIKSMAAKGIVSGYDSTTFGPNASITRAEFCKLISNLYGLVQAGASFGGQTSFNDVATTAWYYPYVQVCASLGVVKGYGEKTFAPDNMISRQEMCAIMDRTITMLNTKLTAVNAAKTFADNADIYDYAKDSVSRMYQDGIMSGTSDTTFEPQAGATRAMAVVVINNLYTATTSK